jgi:hypothetical protein
MEESFFESPSQQSTVNSQYTPNEYTILTPKVCLYDGTTRGMSVQIDF